MKPDVKILEFVLEQVKHILMHCLSGHYFTPIPNGYFLLF